jgi:predicted PurR-regulated permease PerM
VAVAVGRAIFLVLMVLLIFAFMLATAISLPNLSKLGLGFDQSVFERVTQVTHDVRRYMGIMTGINFLVGLGDALLLWVLGVPYAALWGVLAWVMGFIPAVGFWVALIPPVILAYINQGLQTAAITFAGYVLINGSVQNLIQPRLMGRELRISPVVVFLSLFIWGWLLGGVGAILAVPLTLFIISTLEAFDNTRWMAIFMRLSPERKEGERQEAVDRIKGFGRDVRNVLTGREQSAAS